MKLKDAETLLCRYTKELHTHTHSESVCEREGKQNRTEMNNNNILNNDCHIVVAVAVVGCGGRRLVFCFPSGLYFIRRASRLFFIVFHTIFYFIIRAVFYSVFLIRCCIRGRRFVCRCIRTQPKRMGAHIVLLLLRLWLLFVVVVVVVVRLRPIPPQSKHVRWHFNRTNKKMLAFIFRIGCGLIASFAARMKSNRSSVV